jgi:SH3 domain-containing YSC84-like protein 1
MTVTGRTQNGIEEIFDAFVMSSSLQAESAERANQTRVREDIERELRIKAEKELKRQALEKAQNLADLQSGNTSDTSKVASNLSNEYRDNSQRTVNMMNSANNGGVPFIEPRWQPDEEVTTCNRCPRAFDFYYRKHHCRHCGLIFCDGCTRSKALLPVAFKKTDPQRVCGNCMDLLEPHQKDLADLIANREKTNTISLSDGITRYCNLPFSLTLGSEIRKASYSLHNLFTSSWIEDKAIPAKLVHECAGLAFLTIGKGGVVLAPKFGTGLVIAKLPNGTWSGPSAIGTFGVTWGLLAGADFTDYVIILNTPEAVKAFSGTGNIQLGLEIDVAAGPIGRGGTGGIEVGDRGFASILSYGHSKGLFAGVGLDGSVIITRPDVNFNFYGMQHDAMEILQGDVPPPKAAEPLYEAIMRYVSDYKDDNEDGGGGNRIPAYPGSNNGTTASNRTSGNTSVLLGGSGMSDVTNNNSVFQGSTAGAQSFFDDDDGDLNDHNDVKSMNV